jgi:putative serine protease PepD
MTSTSVKLAAGTIALAALGAVGGAAVYAALAPSTTTTVVAGASSLDAPISGSKGLSASDIYRLVSPGVVDIKVVQVETDPYVQGSSPQDVPGEGTGWVYDRSGDIVTNDHVAGGAKSIVVRFSDNQTFTAHVVGRDTDSDIAVIHVSAPSSLLHPLTLGDSSKVQVGDPVVDIGSPFGHAESLAAGVISGLHVPADSTNNVPTDSIQTDVAINPGNSGGPLLNAAGQVIGITSSTDSRSGYSDGVGFAIPASIIHSVVTQLLGPSHKAKHAYFGASVKDSTSPLGARLVIVPRAGPSAHAGMKTGDVITSMDGLPVASADDMISLTKAHVPGDTLSVSYVRDGKSHTVDVKLGTRPA